MLSQGTYPNDSFTHVKITLLKVYGKILLVLKTLPKTTIKTTKNFPDSLYR